LSDSNRGKKLFKRGNVDKAGEDLLRLRGTRAAADILQGASSGRAYRGERGWGL